MQWLHYTFYALMLAVGGAAFALLLRAKQSRAWIWLAAALLGAAGLVGVATGHAGREERSLALVAVCAIFAADHLTQYVQSRRAAAPKPLQLALSVLWLAFGGLQLVA